VALGSSQPLTEMSTRNISYGVKESVRRADNLTNLLLVKIVWDSKNVHSFIVNWFIVKA